MSSLFNCLIVIWRKIPPNQFRVKLIPKINVPSDFFYAMLTSFLFLELGFFFFTHFVICSFEEIWIFQCKIFFIFFLLLLLFNLLYLILNKIEVLLILINIHRKLPINNMSQQFVRLFLFFYFLYTICLSSSWIQLILSSKNRMYNFKI